MVAASAHGAATPLQVFASAAASQFLIWGAIDAVLAGLGLRAAKKRPVEPIDPCAEAARQVKAIGFVRFNVKLDILYVLIGVALFVWSALATTPGGRAALAGHGTGVVIQGGFLLMFDHFFARRLAASRTPDAAPGPIDPATGSPAIAMS